MNDTQTNFPMATRRALQYVLPGADLQRATRAAAATIYAIGDGGPLEQDAIGLLRRTASRAGLASHRVERAIHQGQVDAYSRYLTAA